MRTSKKIDESKSKPFALLKLIGGVGAVLSLLIALNQVTGLVQTFRIHHKVFSDAIRVGQQQEERGDYAAAFESFKRASETDPIDREAQDLEAHASMLWLENTYILPEDHKFSDIVNPLLPVLDRALAHSKGPKAADLVAHIGWANFLRSRDFRSRGGPLPEGIEVERNYEEALRIDPHNVYAHAMWGHWILWEFGELEPARVHFSTALQTGRARPFVRHLQLYSLYNSDSADANRELFRVANEMRQNQEPIDPGDRHRAFDESIEFRLDRYDELARILGVIRAAEAEATYDWLSQGYEVSQEPFRRERREFIVALLAEIAGNKSEAVSRYRSLRAEARETRDSSLLDRADEALKRLSPVKPN